MEETPLILSSPAARRLKLLLGHGVEFTPHMRQECASLLAGDLSSTAAAPTPLRGAILETEPKQELADDADAVPAECVVTTNTLRALKVGETKLCRGSVYVFLHRNI